ncbi:hypothetical protein E2C01_009353 [Portunus trituberculatus]|uniref:Uncharacterized protein n=1 Tax=Portunus trituberculatus TaxID=210409 RepID=A0A5B7D5H6_PORTR|nr:hypothetical protein [Portunus trituberculatus]
MFSSTSTRTPLLRHLCVFHSRLGAWLGITLTPHDAPGATTFIAGTDTGVVTLYTLTAEEEEAAVGVMGGSWPFSFTSLVSSCPVNVVDVMVVVVVVVVMAEVVWEQDIISKLLGLELLATPLALFVLSTLPSICLLVPSLSANEWKC